MRITILYDNEVYKRGLKPGWGFSCLVEVENAPRILFDTGANGAMLLRNMAKLHIEPVSIAEVFISHAHRDHTGGLADFLKASATATVYVPSSLSEPSGAKELVSVKEPCEIHENIFSTGELSRIEQSLVVKMEKGLVVVAGCSQPGIGSILEAASQFGKF